MMEILTRLVIDGKQSLHHGYQMRDAHAIKIQRTTYTYLDHYFFSCRTANMTGCSLEDDYLTSVWIKNFMSHQDIKG